MIKKVLIVLAMCAAVSAVQAHDETMQEPLLVSASINKLELFRTQDASENHARLDADLTFGYDLNKFQLGVKAERAEGTTKELSVMALGVHALSAYWDLEYGVAQQRWLPVESSMGLGETRSQLVVGMSGLAPYFVDINSRFFLGDTTKLQWTLDVEKEWLLTQRLALIPYAEILASAEADPSNNLASGFNRFELGINLRYQILREFAPYLGVRRESWFGDNLFPAQLDATLRNHLARKDETFIVFGVNWWY